MNFDFLGKLNISLIHFINVQRYLESQNSPVCVILSITMFLTTQLEIRWNFSVAFVGCATDAPPSAEDSDDSRSLNYPTFLAAPLLDINDSGKERKCSGNEEIAKNTDPVGHVIDTFVHHALEDSFGEILFVDVQGEFQAINV